ncbi:MAG: LPP20 family lipoprotein [Treponema sp.]|nr:LPP20 family lipoprotein [Treponema sp.]
MSKISMPNIKRTAAGLFVLALVLSACAGGPASAGGGRGGEPQWVSDPYLVYPRAIYLAAVGYGPGRDSAEKNALGALTAIFNQSISSETEINVSYSEALVKSGSTWSENSDIAQTVKTSVQMNTLIGAEIADVWDDGKGTVYAAAVMDKFKTGSVYSELIRQNQLTIARLTALSDGEKQSFDGYVKYQQASSLADANMVFVNVMKVIDIPSFGEGELKSGEYYRIEASEIAKNISMAVTVDNDRQGRIRGAFAQALSASGFRTGGANPRYALTASLTLEPVTFEGNPYRWIRYFVESNLVDLSSGTAIFPYSITGREGHNSASEAETRALRAAETSIRDEYGRALGEFLSQNISR